MDFGGLQYSYGESNASVHLMALGMFVAVVACILTTKLKKLTKPLLVVAAAGGVVGAVGGVWMAFPNVYRHAKFLTGDTSVLTATIPKNYNGFIINPLGVPVTRQIV